MCMPHEEEYEQCFDYMENWGSNYFGHLQSFLGQYGMLVLDEGEVKRAVLDALGKCHEQKFVRPMDDMEKEIFYDEWVRKIATEHKTCVILEEYNIKTKELENKNGN